MEPEGGQMNEAQARCERPRRRTRPRILNFFVSARRTECYFLYDLPCQRVLFQTQTLLNETLPKISRQLKTSCYRFVGRHILSFGPFGTAWATEKRPPGRTEEIGHDGSMALCFLRSFEKRRISSGSLGRLYFSSWPLSSRSRVSFWR